MEHITLSITKRAIKDTNLYFLVFPPFQIGNIFYLDALSFLYTQLGNKTLNHLRKTEAVIVGPSFCDTLYLSALLNSNVNTSQHPDRIMSTPVEEEIREADRLEKERRAQWRAEQIKELRLNSRLSFPYPMRLMLATSASFLVGAGLGVSHGAQSAGYRFRAENAHRLPNSSTGWYLYHKSKNYHRAFAGAREGLKMGAKVSFWTAGFFSVEEMFDRYRGTRDCFSTTIASLAVAGGFSLWSMQCFPSLQTPIPRN